jgi:hypothetical protein
VTAPDARIELVAGNRGFMAVPDDDGFWNTPGGWAQARIWFLGFQSYSGPLSGTGGAPADGYVFLRVPCWFLALSTGAVPFATVWFWARRQFRDRARTPGPL